jgi:hypothetical protein
MTEADFKIFSDEKERKQYAQQFRGNQACQAGVECENQEAQTSLDALT